MAPSSSDPKTKSFIISHMNGDHQDSLALYLRVYCHVSSGTARSAKLEDITLNDLLISAKGTRYTVPLDPPMKSLSETRARVVAMHKECLATLGLSDIVIKEYKLPRGGQIVAFGLCAAFFALFSRRSHFLPGSAVYETVGLDKFPNATEFCHQYQPHLFFSILGAHIVEASLLAWKRLRVHGVPFLSGVWCAWYASTVVEGMSAWVRFNGMVKKEQSKREKHQ